MTPNVIVKIDGTMLYYMIFWLSLWNCKTVAQYSDQIDDIPIEHYAHEDIQHDEIDVELMPRSSRKLPLDDNKSSDLEFNENRDVKNYLYDLCCKNKHQKQSRSKRDTISKNSQNQNEKIEQPLELLVIDTVNITEKTNDTNLENKNVLINDFIKFKRSTNLKTKTDLQKGGKFVQSIPNPQPRKLSLDSSKEKDVTRKTRGAVKEQWVKQTQTVRRDENIYDDNLQLSSQVVRAPRAHFVTNGMSETDPLEYKFNREPRSEATNKYLGSDLPDEYYQPRFSKNYVSRGDRFSGNYDRYVDRRNYNRRQEYPEKPLNYNADYNDSARKRRIIYYATLPDAPRSFRIDDQRRPYDRQYFRDRYDYRFLTPEAHETNRKRYSDSPRYDVNVSTGVNVREVQKNPERRIYSDVDRTSYPEN